MAPKSSAVIVLRTVSMRPTSQRRPAKPSPAMPPRVKAMIARPARAELSAPTEPVKSSSRPVPSRSSSPTRVPSANAKSGQLRPTIERWFGAWLRQRPGERISLQCRQILGIDEHFFTRKHGYATTFCDLRNHKIHDVVLGRSEASLESYFHRLEGKHLVKVVCMDLAAVYRAIVRKHFPNLEITLVNTYICGQWRAKEALPRR